VTLRTRRPAKLAVAVVADQYASIRALVDRLRAQDGSEQIELVIAVPSVEEFQLPDLPELARAEIVEVGSLDPLAPARAAAVRAATAPFVFVAETHTLPCKGWAAATIAAHERGAGAVVPGIRNGNPSDGVSWGCLIVDYGRWLGSGTPREIGEIPGYNTSYRREALTDLDGQLDELLEQGSGLAVELKRRGERIRLDPSARVEHLNLSRRLHWVHDSFLAGRVLATIRIERWSTLRRLVYFAGSPLIPLLQAWRLRRIWPELRHEVRAPAATLLAFVAVCSTMAAGEMSGYVVPAGRGEQRRMTDNELKRALYLSERP
jgi:hypothetical protein